MLIKECKDRDKALANNTANLNMKHPTITEWTSQEPALKEITSIWPLTMEDNTEIWKEQEAVVLSLVVKELDQWLLRLERMEFEIVSD